MGLENLISDSLACWAYKDTDIQLSKEQYLEFSKVLFADAQPIKAYIYFMNSIPGTGYQFEYMLRKQSENVKAAALALHATNLLHNGESFKNSANLLLNKLER